LTRALRLAPGDLVVLHASNFSAVKRVLDVIEAARVAILRDPRLVFVMLGDGPERDRAQAACARWGLRRRFRFPGWVHHGEMPRYFRLADCVVVASAHETQSLVYLEAQASGKCVVASRVPGAREVITNGKTGFLFDPGDVTGLAALLVAMAADPGRRTAVGRAGHARVAAHALSRVTDAYEEALWGLGEAKTSGRRATRTRARVTSRGGPGAPARAR
jgi:glycosyltransferase involved in cell wall biosynthesis